MHILIATSDFRLGRHIQSALARISLPCEAVALNWAALLERAPYPPLVIVDYRMLSQGGEGRADLGLRRLLSRGPQASVLVLQPDSTEGSDLMRFRHDVELLPLERLVPACLSRAAGAVTAV